MTYNWLLILSSFALMFQSSTPTQPHQSQRSMIIGGTEPPVGRYPYAVYLMDQESPFCGGSLIAPDMVLTAGHCLSMTEGVQTFTVVIGRHNVTNTSAGEEFTNVWGIPHPDYNLYKGDDNDFGLILLPNRTKENITLVQLNRNDTIPTGGQLITYFGWGVTSQNSTDPPASDVPLEVQAAVVPNSACSVIHGVYKGFNESYSGYITDNMICTLDADKDSCQKDSGGPGIIKGDNATNDLQVGVISWGLGCATNIFPGVSSRVSKAYTWIREEVCEMSTAPPESFGCQDTNTYLALHSTENSTATANVNTSSSSVVSTKSSANVSPSGSASACTLNKGIITFMFLVWLYW